MLVQRFTESLLIIQLDTASAQDNKIETCQLLLSQSKTLSYDPLDQISINGSFQDFFRNRRTQTGMTLAIGQKENSKVSV